MDRRMGGGRRGWKEGLVEGEENRMDRLMAEKGRSTRDEDKMGRREGRTMENNKS